MNILVLSCGTGGGHNTAGYAVADELKRRGHAVFFEDAFGLIGENAAKLVNNTYIKTVQYAPKVFGAVYSFGEAYGSHTAHSAVYWANGKCASALADYLEEHNIDVVVMTHVFAAHMLSNLKDSGVDVPRSYFVSTDYTCHPFVEEANCDYVVIPSAQLAWAFMRQGIPNGKLLPLGIPVKTEFSDKKSKEDACAAVGLDPAYSYVLLSGGSIGASAMSDSIKILLAFLDNNPNYHLVVICGSNTRLQEKLEQSHRTNAQMHIVGKTSQMHDYMHASDMFITKPGGLSTTEAAVCGIPLIHMPPIPGCESYNVRFFESNGMSIAVKDTEKELLSAMTTLQQKDMAVNMREAQWQTINRRSTKDLCDHIENPPQKETMPKQEFTTVPLRLSKEEAAVLKAAAQDKGMTVSELVKSLLIDRQ